MTRSFDAIVVGAGQAGPPLARRLTAAGMNVALVERKLVGGTCINTGCMPTKALIACAYAAHLSRRAADYGVRIGGAIDVDMKRVHAYADTVRTKARTALEESLRGMERLTLFEGHARFEGPQTLRVGDARLAAPRIFLDVGGRARIPDMPGVDRIKPLTNTSILDLDTLPAHLVVIGGSYIGLEFAQAYRRFGARVTIVERSAHLIDREDRDVSDAIRGIVEDEGIVVRTGAECIRFAPHAEGVEVGVDCTDGPGSIVGTHVLLAVGRAPNTADLGLETAGIATDARGYITVDEGLETNVEGVYALGDCNGHGAFTHTAYNDFEIVTANLLDGAARKVGDRILGYALYVDPPLGRVGITEAEARKSGRPILVAKRPMTLVSRAVEKGETKGFMKVVVDAGTKKILGAAILGVGGDEVVHGILDMMHAGAPYPVLQWAVPIHPTVSELVPTLLGSLEPV